jgi:PKD repeat protein
VAFNLTKSFANSETDSYWVTARVLLSIPLLIALSACLSGGGEGDSGAVTTTSTPVTNVSFVSSRTTGVAPLSVFFDATGVTDTSTTNPFHELQYVWSFGDPTSGTWQVVDGGAARSKNRSTGPMAVHVFETPGTYTVQLSVSNGTTISTTTASITVTDPDVVFASPNTYCFSTNGDFTDCPAGTLAGQKITTSNFGTAISTYQGAGRRLLFKRGQTFTKAVADVAKITSNGPGLIGAFGSGAKPKVVLGLGNEGVVINVGVLDGDDVINSALLLSSPGTPTITDWRVMDLEIDGQSNDLTSGVGFEGGMDQVTIQRVNIHHTMLSGIGNSIYSIDFLPGAHIWDQLTVSDSVIANIGSYGAYIAGTRLAWIGNEINDTSDGGLGGAPDDGTHNYRSEYLDKAVISNNIFKYPRTIRHSVKIHAPCQGGALCTPVAALPNTYTQNVLISQNKFEVRDSHQWSVVIAPQDDGNDERIRRVIVEKNIFTGDGKQNVPLRIHASDVSVRDNLFIAISGAGPHSYYPIMLTKDLSAPLTDGVSIISNTSYTSLSGDYSLVNMDRLGMTGAVIKNNLVYAPNVGAPTLILNPTAIALVSSNNSSNAQIKSTFPDWVNPAPSIPADFHLGATSYGRNAGTSVKLFSDYDDAVSPAGSYDMGAFERN